MTYQEEQEALDRIVGSFPKQFGLRAYPGDVFRVDRFDSFWTHLDRRNGYAMLYTHRLCEDGVWRTFCKGTEAELRRELRPL